VGLILLPTALLEETQRFAHIPCMWQFLPKCAFYPSLPLFSVFIFAVFF
jgi:hypothetical protein